MKINFTKKEYRLLIEMLYLSDWMMHSHIVREEQNEYEVLKKKILSCYKEMGSDDIIELDKGSKEYYERKELEEYVHDKVIKKYDEEVFWDGLIDKLSVRDVIREIGIEQYNALEGIERLTKIDEISERYANEFEQFGLERVRIDPKEPR